MKTLDEIKDEYAREKGFETGSTFTAWEKLFMHPHLLKEGIPIIATRFAAEQNQQMKSEILELRKYLPTAINVLKADLRNGFLQQESVRDAAKEEITKWENILTKTAHYEN